MKKLLFVLTAITLVSLVACKTADKKPENTLSSEERTKMANDSANFTSIEWLDSINTDLGNVKEGAIVEVSYRFKNAGNKTLVIEDVSAGCGCTVPEKPEQPFAPGQEGVIKASFNGSGSGMISKSVTVTANTNPTLHNLTFTGEIKEK